MRILYDNQVEDATITSYSENPQMKWEDALLDTRLSRMGQSAGVDDEWIKFAFSGAVSASYCVIHNHNLTDSATVKIQGNATDTWGSPSLEETLTVDDVCYVSFTEDDYQYWRLYLDDPTNTDGYIQLSKVFLGTYLQMPSFARTYRYPKRTTSIATKSGSGQLYGDRRIRPRVAEFQFNNISEADRLLIETFFDEVENIRPYTLIIWENDLDVQLPVWVNNTVELLDWQKADVEGLRWNFPLSVEQCF